jgi:hypothetical protein
MLPARRYAAAVVYADGSCSVAHQLKAAEYGSTTDPVTLLLPGMLSKQRDGNRPTHIIQVRKMPLCTSILLSERHVQRNRNFYHEPYARTAL